MMMNKLVIVLLSGVVCCITAQSFTNDSSVDNVDNVVCKICGDDDDGLEITLPDVLIEFTQMNLTESCGRIGLAGEAGLLPAELCPGIQDALFDICGCALITDTVIASPPPTIAPVTFSPMLATAIPITMAPATDQYCDDDRFATFYVKETGKNEPCVWLADSTRATFKTEYCVQGEPAYEICQETCDVCTDACDDTHGTFHYRGVDRTCLWLKLRNSVIDELCFDAASEAASVCPETCNTCDAPVPCSICGQGKTVTLPYVLLDFTDSEDSIVRCSELEDAGFAAVLSPHFCRSLPSLIETICGCAADLAAPVPINTLTPTITTTPFPTPLPTITTPTTTTPFPTPLPTNSPPTTTTPFPTNPQTTITPFPTNPQTTNTPFPTNTPPPAIIGCDDDRYATFFVQETGKSEPCVWLADPTRSNFRNIYCVQGQDAYGKCRETCGACSDLCEDTNGSFDYNGTQRSCLWLSLRNVVINQVCVPGNEAAVVCPETCDVCDPTTPSNPSPPPPNPTAEGRSDTGD